MNKLLIFKKDFFRHCCWGRVCNLLLAVPASHVSTGSAVALLMRLPADAPVNAAKGGLGAWFLAATGETWEKFLVPGFGPAYKPS